ncbi:hypothetical protein HG530_002667 [Fusarium avenaceum]|nr:hypothetical protein HG530_002667 [Fusarium avenaceum]
MNRCDPDLAVLVLRAGTVLVVESVAVENVGELALAVSLPDTLILDKVDDAHATGRKSLGCMLHKRKKMLCENPVGEVVGLPLSLMAVLCHFKGCSHDASIVDKTVQSCLKSEEVLSSLDDTGEVHEIHLKKIDLN